MPPKIHVLYGPPGTGKTHTLLDLLEAELQSGVQPEAIAFATFTRAARGEARARVKRRFGLMDDQMPWFRTLHSMAFRLIGADPKKIMQPVHWREFCEKYGFNLTSYKIDPSDDSLLPPQVTADDLYRSMYNWGAQRRLDAGATYDRFAHPGKTMTRFAHFVRSYNDYKKEHGLIDFNDMLYRAERAEPPPLTCAFLDEAQDLTPMQAHAAMLWFAGCDRIYISGDDDQCIYTFSAADPDWLISLAMTADEKGFLTRSYRVPQRPHLIAQAIVRQNIRRVEKKYLPNDKRGWVGCGSRQQAIEHIDRMAKGSRKTVFVLFRNRCFIEKWANDLLTHGVPYAIDVEERIGPIKHRTIRAVIAATELSRGRRISMADFKSILEHIPASEKIVPKGLKTAIKKMTGEISPEKIKTMLNFGGLLKLIETSGPTAVLMGKHEKLRSYYQQLTMGSWNLAQISKHPPVLLMTVHASKGREADLVVIVPDMSPRSYKSLGSIPGREDERRIAYVAVTRTKNALFFVNPETKKFFSYRSYYSPVVREQNNG